MSKDTSVVGVRLAPDEMARLDALATERGCSRSEALRLALTYGLTFAKHGFGINVTRLLFILEHVAASVDVIMAREHGDVYPQLEVLANQRMEDFHA